MKETTDNIKEKKSNNSSNNKNGNNKIKSDSKNGNNKIKADKKNNTNSNNINKSGNKNNTNSNKNADKANDNTNKTELKDITIKKNNNNSKSKSSDDPASKSTNQNLATAKMSQTKIATDTKVTHEDNLELSELSMKERSKIKRDRIKANMEGMDKGEKIKYLIMYFKWYAIISIICLIAAIYTGYTIYQNNRPVALSYAIVNCRNQDTLNTGFEQDYKETFNMTDKKYKILRDSELYLGNPVAPDDMEQQDYINVTKVSTLCFNDFYDVFIMDELGANYAAAQGMLFPLTTYFADDVYNQIKAYEFIAKDNDGNMSPVALDISGTEFAKSLNLNYDKVYIGFTGREDTNYLNSVRMINYSLNLGLDLTTDGRPRLK